MFDTDSTAVGIDNQASACMSDHTEDFSGPWTQTNGVIRGFAGTCTSNIQMRTIEWQFEDDFGKVTKHCIPNSYFVRLLSPQHWAQTLPTSRRPQKGQETETTFQDGVELQ